MAVAEKYVTAFQSLARTNNTLILPANTGDVSSMVAQVINKIIGIPIVKLAMVKSSKKSSKNITYHRYTYHSLGEVKLGS